MLRCEASSPEEVAYTWLQNGVAVNNTERRYQEGGNLKFTAVDRTLDSGNFQCVALVNATGEQTHSNNASFNIKCECGSPSYLLGTSLFNTQLTRPRPPWGLPPDLVLMNTHTHAAHQLQLWPSALHNYRKLNITRPRESYFGPARGLDRGLIHCPSPRLIAWCSVRLFMSNRKKVSRLKGGSCFRGEVGIRGILFLIIKTEVPTPADTLQEYPLSVWPLALVF